MKPKELSYEEYNKKLCRIFRRGIKRGLEPQDVLMKLFEFAGGVKIIYKKEGE